MKKFIKPRQTGKTTRLIEIAERTGAYIVTPTQKRAQIVADMARKQGRNILHPVPFDLAGRSFKGSHVRHILIDDADDILRSLFRDVTIDAITMTEEENGTMTDALKKRVLQTAIRTWGKKAQVDMMIEEMAELTIALMHERRGRYDNVSEEMADVYIMLEQMKLIFGNEYEVEKIMNEKIDRLNKRLAELILKRALEDQLPFPDSGYDHTGVVSGADK